MATKTTEFFAEQCPFCKRVRWYWVDEDKGEDSRSEWKDALPDGVTVKKFGRAACDRKACVKQNIADLQAEVKDEGLVPASGKILVVSRGSIKSFAKQPRKYFDQAKLEALAKSIKRFGQLVPVFVRELPQSNGYSCRYELIDGERRFRACGIAKVDTMKIIIFTVKDEDDQFAQSVLANLGRVDHDPIEIALAIQHFVDKKMPTDEIADMFTTSISWVAQHLKILSLDERVRNMMSMSTAEENRLPFSHAVVIADLPKEKQLAMAKQVVQEKLKVFAVKVLVGSKTGKPNAAIGGAERSPNRDYKQLRRLLRHIHGDVAIFADMNQQFFNKMFLFRNASDRHEMVDLLERSIFDLGAVLDAIKEVKKA